LPIALHNPNMSKNVEMLSVLWRSKIRNAWGQYKCVSTLWRCLQTLKVLA